MEKKSVNSLRADYYLGIVIAQTHIVVIISQQMNLNITQLDSVANIVNLNTKIL
jgi:hypothetical protein